MDVCWSCLRTIHLAGMQAGNTMAAAAIQNAVCSEAVMKVAHSLLRSCRAGGTYPIITSDSGRDRSAPSRSISSSVTTPRNFPPTAPVSVTQAKMLLVP
jgi:hypothetical protein